MINDSERQYLTQMNSSSKINYYQVPSIKRLTHLTQYSNYEKHDSDYHKKAFNIQNKTKKSVNIYYFILGVGFRQEMICSRKIEGCSQDQE